MALCGFGLTGVGFVLALVDGAVADRAGPRWAMVVGITVAGLGVMAAVRLQRRSI